MLLTVSNRNVDVSQKRLLINGKIAVGILFSGGVESTALIQHALDQGYSPYCFSYKLSINQIEHEANMIEICKLYDVPYKIMDLRECAPNEFGYSRRTHPWWAIAGSIVAVSMPNLAYLWIGANSGLREVGDDGGDALPMYGDAISTISMANKIVKGNMITTMPLSRMTKVQQYMMIKEDVRKHIVTCEDMSSDGPCGCCKKCIELDALFNDKSYRTYCS